MYCNPAHDQYFKPFLNYKSTENMIWIVQSICEYLDNNLFFNAAFFNLIGSLGIIILYSTLKEIEKNKKIFFYYYHLYYSHQFYFGRQLLEKKQLLLLHFQSFYGLIKININRNKFLFLFSLVLLFISKPYIFIIVIFCIIILLILSRNISVFHKILILLIVLPPLYYIFSLIVQYITGYDIFAFINNLDNWYYSLKKCFLHQILLLMIIFLLNLHFYFALNILI